MENKTAVILNAEPIHNIVKGNLVQHSHEKLGAKLIETLTLEITETIEFFLNKQLKEGFN